MTHDAVPIPMSAENYVHLAARRDEAHQAARGAVKDMVFAAIPLLMAFATWRAARAARAAISDELERAVAVEPAEEPGEEERGDRGDLD
jgi:hypothetical protein